VGQDSNPVRKPTGLESYPTKPTGLESYPTKPTGLESCPTKSPAAFLPKITDFGLAKFHEKAALPTQTNLILGTPEYMAPEQAEGQSRVGPATDVYALGALLYTLLTGRPPFQGPSALETLLLVKTQEPVAPTQLQPGLPRDLQTVCLRCLQKDPARRYPSALALAEDCAAFLKGEPIRARPVGPVERAAKWARRRPAVAALLAVIAGLLVAVAAGSLVEAGVQRQLANDRETARGKAVVAQEREAGLRTEADEQRDLVRRQRDAARQNLYWAEMGVAGEVTALAGGTRRVQDLLGHWRPTEGEPDRRCWAWYYLNGLGPRPRLTLRRHTGPMWAVSWSPDGRRLASANGMGSVQLWDTASGRQVGILRGHSGAVLAVRWSPDGRRLATGGWDETVKLWDPDSEREVAAFRLPEGSVVHALAWAPDSRRLAVGSRGPILLWDAGTGRPVATLDGHTRDVNGLSWSPDGRRLASCGGDADLHVWDGNDGRPLARWRAHGGWVFALSWSPDGRRLATGGRDHVARIWDMTAYRRIASLDFRAPQGKQSGLGRFRLSVTTDPHPLATAVRHGRLRQSGNPWLCLGAAYYGAGEAQPAIDALTRSLTPGREDDPYACLFLALAHHDLKQTEEARRWHERALGWLKAHPPDDGVSDLAREVMAVVMGLSAEQTEQVLRQCAYEFQLAACTRNIASHPGDSAPLVGRGEWYARHRHWKEALADMVQAIALHPEWHQPWYRAVPLFLEAGDVEGYRRHCQAMLNRFGDSDDANVAERTAKSCLLLPGTVEDLTLPVRLAHRAVVRGAASADLKWFQLAEGMAAYREGRFEEAIALCSQSRAANAPAANAELETIDCLFLAMAQHRLGKEDEARRWLQEATAIEARQAAQTAGGDLGGAWSDRVLAQIVRREADALVGAAR
jgi:tetratricopeptide (TPR) repeat protein